MFMPGQSEIDIFIIPIAKDIIDNLIVTYNQRGHTVFEKTEYEAESHNIYDPENPEHILKNVTYIYITLNQTDTLRLINDTQTECQINIITKGDDQPSVRLTSQVFTRCNGSQLHRNEMVVEST